MSDAKIGQANKRGYFGEIVQSAKSVMEGMAITFAELTRMPRNTTTVQYPDRTPFPVVDTLPERYRGFLEVDLELCTGCKACERDCPINVIAIDLEKIGAERMLTRFDIDIGKCMFCGICVEACPVEAQGPGDAEKTKCIRMTREFEAVSGDLSALTFRFIRPGDQIPPNKLKKGGELSATRRRGEIAREVRAQSQIYNPGAMKWALERMPPVLSPDDAELLAEEAVTARAVELGEKLAALGSEPRGVEDLIYNQALAQTDVGQCGYANCREYARAIAEGREPDGTKCGPGGVQAARDATLIQSLHAGKSTEEAAKAATAAALRRRK